MDLEKLRLDIDAIDVELLRLFSRRMEIVGRIAEYKRQAGVPVFDAEREKNIIAEIRKNANPAFEGETAEIFKALMEVSRWYQSRIINPLSLIHI